MVACLFSRKVYSQETLSECLRSVGLPEVGDALTESSALVQRLRWGLKFRSGFDPLQVKIPKRFSEVVSWKGKMDPVRLQDLAGTYSGAVRSMAEEGMEQLRAGLEQPRQEAEPEEPEENHE
jgi:aldehyde:ferredoxin oxidoreductase